MKAEPKEFCRCCGHALPNPEKHLPQIFTPIPDEWLLIFIKGNNTYHQPGRILGDALASNLPKLIAYPMTNEEIFQQLFGNSQYINRESVIAGIDYDLRARGCYHQDEKTKKWSLKEDNDQ